MNLVAIPLFNLVLVPLTLLATLLLQVDALAATAAPAVLLVVGWLAAHTVAILHSVAAAPLAALAVPHAPPVTIALAACGVVLALCARPLPARGLAWLAVLPMFFPARDVPAPGAARIVVLDVGQGLAVSVATHTHRLLFDAGPSFRSGFDSGDDIVLPALAASGPSGLDRLIVSHADNDHAGGAVAVLAAFPEADVLEGPDVSLPLGRVCERGENWEWDGVHFAILHPAGDFAPRGNESSCVLAVKTRGGVGADHGRHRGPRRECDVARGPARKRRRGRAAPRQRDVVLASVRRRRAPEARARFGGLRESLGVSEARGPCALGARWSARRRDRRRRRAHGLARRARGRARDRALAAPFAIGRRRAVPCGDGGEAGPRPCRSDCGGRALRRRSGAGSAAKNVR